MCCEQGLSRHVVNLALSRGTMLGLTRVLLPAVWAVYYRRGSRLR